MTYFLKFPNVVLKNEKYKRRHYVDSTIRAYKICLILLMQGSRDRNIYSSITDLVTLIVTNKSSNIDSNSHPTLNKRTKEAFASYILIK